MLQGLEKFSIDGAGGSNIKSIQRGVLRLDGASGSETVTITAVDLTKAVVKISYNGMSYTFTDSTQAVLPSAEITSSTTVVISRGIDSGDMWIPWEVIEFNNVKSLQKGTAVALAYDSFYGFDVQSVGIATVDPLKSIVFFNYKSLLAGGSDMIYAGVACEVEASLVRFTTKVDYDYSVHWQLVEFY